MPRTRRSPRAVGQRRWASAAILLVVAALLVWSQVAGGGEGSGTEGPSDTLATAQREPASECPTVLVPPDGSSIVAPVELPPQARDTLSDIDRGGPFEFDQDGSVFQNRERLLPIEERGYYREYTVVTPGEDDRGARRIVAGDCGERWYTADHYESFAWVTT